MAGEWRRQTIGDLCDNGEAEIRTGPFGSQLHSYDYVEDGVPVVPTEALRDRKIKHGVLPHISHAKAAELSQHRLEEGDILFARRGVQATGHIGYVRAREEGFVCGTGAIRLRISSEQEVSGDFLSHVLANPASIAWFKHHAIGATMPNLNESIIRAFSFSVPPLREQYAIASFLSAIDDKIDLNQRMNETLEALAGALFKAWFLDFAPVQAKGEGLDTGLPAEVAALFPDRFEDTEVGEVPAGWKVRSIGDLAEVVGGSTPSTKNPAFWEQGVHCWATPKDLSGLSVPVLLDTERRVSDTGLSQISSGLLPVGTVLLSSRAPIGYLAIAEVPVAINQGFIAMRPNPTVSNLFLLFWARYAHDVIVSRANGSTFLEISKRNFRPIPVVSPQEPVMQAFDERARPLYARIVSNERESRTLVALRETLLPRLITGEIRLPEAEKALEATL